jgi:site-specific recombinase XerD
MSHKFDFTFCPKKRSGYIDGPVTVYLRITVKGKRLEIATHHKVDPAQWDYVAHRVKGKSQEARAMNTNLDVLQNKLYDCHTQLLQNGVHITAEVLRNSFIGKDEREFGLVEMMKAHHENIKKLAGKSLDQSTINKFGSTVKHVEEFIKWKYHLSELQLRQLKYAFIADFAYYLRTEKNIGNNTIEKHFNNLNRVVKEMVKRGTLRTNPFTDFKIHRITADRTFLSEEELQDMIDKEIRMERISQVRDIFIFSCYTGLSYIDVANLTPDNIVTGIDGSKWIFTSRQKTGTKSNIPLLDPALEIIKRYKNHPVVLHKNVLLPVISNQKMNAYLKEIADICGIKKELTFHCARHTFATTVTLSNDVPIESVSKMLGHTKIQTTQHYAKILDKKVSNDMLLLKTKMSERRETKNPLQVPKAKSS